MEISKITRKGNRYEARIEGLGPTKTTTVIGEGFSEKEAREDAIKKAEFFTRSGRN